MKQHLYLGLLKLNVRWIYAEAHFQSCHVLCKFMIGSLRMKVVHNLKLEYWEKIIMFLLILMCMCHKNYLLEIQLPSMFQWQKLEKRFHSNWLCHYTNVLFDHREHYDPNFKLLEKLVIDSTEYQNSWLEHKLSSNLISTLLRKKREHYHSRRL